MQCSESTDFADRRRWESLFLMPEDHLNRHPMDVPYETADVYGQSGQSGVALLKWCTNKDEATNDAEI